MKKNGFTLIELLGVIVIISLLIIIIFPQIINSIKSSKEKNDNLTKELIYNAADLFLDKYSEDYPKESDNTYCITLTDLIGEGYLNSPLKLSNSKDDITKTMSVEVKYNDGFNYELKQSSDCTQVSESIICEAVTDKTKTYGNVPNGKYELGDEYICEVFEDKLYHFFVVKNDNENNEVNLIIEYNDDLSIVSTNIDSGLEEFVTDWDIKDKVSLPNLDYLNYDIGGDPCPVWLMKDGEYLEDTTEITKTCTNYEEQICSDDLNDCSVRYECTIPSDNIITIDNYRYISSAYYNSGYTIEEYDVYDEDIGEYYDFLFVVDYCINERDESTGSDGPVCYGTATLDYPDKCFEEEEVYFKDVCTSWDKSENIKHWYDSVTDNHYGFWLDNNKVIAYNGYVYNSGNEEVGYKSSFDIRPVITLSKSQISN